MTTPAILNSLLRLDGVTGEPPSPFERPNDTMDFFVLELGQHNSVDGWCAHTADTLRCHAELIRRLRGAGAKASLFVAYAASVPVLRLEVSFLRLLCEAGITLECTQDCH